MTLAEASASLGRRVVVDAGLIFGAGGQTRLSAVTADKIVLVGRTTTALPLRAVRSIIAFPETDVRGTRQERIN